MERPTRLDSTLTSKREGGRKEDDEFAAEHLARIPSWNAPQMIHGIQLT